MRSAPGSHYFTSKLCWLSPAVPSGAGLAPETPLTVPPAPLAPPLPGVSVTVPACVGCVPWKTSA